MYNKSKNKIAFLLGAGASTPFIKYNDNVLTTEYLTNALFCRQNWENILNKFKINIQSNQSTTVNINIDDIMFIVNKINNILDKKEYKNFEYAIHLLDKISIYLSNYLSKKSKKYKSINNSVDVLLIDFFQKINDELLKYTFRNSDSYIWRYVPVLAREIIISSILDLWNEIDKEAKQNKIEINKKFYEKTLQTNTSVNIYSLNYDPLIYESLKINKNFITGFDNDAKFNSSIFFNANSIIAFIHGHIGFLPFLSNDIKFSGDYSPAQDIRIKDIFNFSLNGNTIRFTNKGMKGMHYNTYIATGLDKIDAFSLNPFASYIHRFGKDIIESDYIVLVGVSLNDYHLNSFLTNALFLQVPNKKIVIVTYMDINEVRKKLNIESKENLLIKIIDFFNESIILENNINGNLIERCKKYYKSLNNCLENKGYAKLSENIVLYIKGTEEFYNEESLCSLFD